MFKFIGKLLFLISMYELGKYVTNEILIRLEANDDIDVPLDFVKTDHLHLNKI
ncbi:MULTISPECIES: transcriptional activator RinB [Staphylococcus]|uniref:Transcriptional regulator n=1 Tax=Staphylococcus hominis TaxID=1290 RepID=A0A974QP61_STAHO|nr:MULTISPECIES: transcriptional regulator [Staphylococcus]PTK31893.1 transcriptional regulator [Staphylococcus hominis]